MVELILFKGLLQPKIGINTHQTQSSIDQYPSRLSLHQELSSSLSGSSSTSMKGGRATIREWGTKCIFRGYPWGTIGEWGTTGEWGTI